MTWTLPANPDPEAQRVLGQVPAALRARQACAAVIRICRPEWAGVEWSGKSWCGRAERAECEQGTGKAAA